MNLSKYLIVYPGPRHYQPRVRLVAKLGKELPPNAVAIKLNLDIPNSLFQKPQLQATIKINESDISRPVINAQVMDNIKAELQKTLGIEMTINIVDPA